MKAKRKSKRATARKERMRDLPVVLPDGAIVLCSREEDAVRVQNLVDQTKAIRGLVHQAFHANVRLLWAMPQAADEGVKRGE